MVHSRWWMALIALVAVACAAKAVKGNKVADAEAAVLRSPSDGEVWIGLARAHVANGDATAASAAYSRAVALGASDPALVRQLGIPEIPVDTGYPGGESLHRAALANPDDDELWGDLGDYYRSLGDPETALSHYTYAFSVDPGDSEWVQNIVELGGPDAVAEIIESLRRGATDDEALGDLGDLLREAEAYEEACDLYRQAFDQDPHDSEWERKVRQCDDDPSSWEDTAIDTGARGLIGGGGYGYGAFGGDTGSGPVAADLALARAAAISGDKEKALEHLDNVLESEPSNWEAMVTRALLTNKTVNEVQAEIAETAEDDEVWGDLGDQLVFAGQYRDAIEAYTKALELDPTDSEWRNKIDVLAPLVP